MQTRCICMYIYMYTCIYSIPIYITRIGSINKQLGLQKSHSNSNNLPRNKLSNSVTRLPILSTNEYQSKFIARVNFASVIIA